MFRGRPVRRSLLISACLALALTAAGCLRSTGLRAPAGSEPSPSNLKLQPAANSVALPPTTQIPVAAALPSSNAAASPAQPAAAPVAPASAVVEIPLQASPAPAATPMLDEALERVEAVNRERNQVRAEESLPKPSTPRDAPAPPPPPDLPPATEPPQAVAPPALLPDLEAIKPPATDPDPDPKPVAETPRPEPEKPAPEPEPAAKPEPEASASSPAAELKITELKLCRNVTGFGSFTPIESTLKPGSLVLLYCELAGIGYEPRGQSFVSRFSSRIQVRSSRDDRVVWERDLGVAEDVCRKERRDYYVSYRFLLPSVLTAGTYTVELTQTDLFTRRTTTASLSLAIAE